MDGPSVLAAATEIFRQRNFSQVVAACREALAANPEEDVELRLLLGRALMALRRDAEAQIEVAHCLKLRPRCPEAYQLLGELAFRRDELNAAEIFFREALRLHGRNAHTQVLLDVVQSLRSPNQLRNRPAAAAAKLPAASAAAGPYLRATAPDVLPEEAPTLEAPREKQRRKRLALGSDPGVESDREAIARAPGPEQVALKVAGREGGFGEYLVHAGVLTRAQLFAVLHRHYHENLRIGDACVKLGFARPREIEHHLTAYHDRRSFVHDRRSSVDDRRSSVDDRS